MKLSKVATILPVLAGLAWGQAQSGIAVKTNAVKAAAAANQAVSNAALANPATSTATSAIVKTAVKPEPPALKPDAKISARNKRDPFLSPIVNVAANPQCAGGGKKCLFVDQIVLRGVVRSPDGMIAVVENSAAKAYFLHENDPVFNGYVMKITGDSIVFRETVTDRIGRKSKRDVVKRVSPPAV
jgi:Tfp pilus assembly protein PilP